MRTDWTSLYEMLLLKFMRQGGIRPRDLEASTIKNIMAFGSGENAYFEEDRWLVIDFCRMVIAVY